MKTALRWAVWSTAAAILSFELFVPPILGLSDQGDFARMIGRFGYGPEDPSPLWNAFVKRKYVPDASFRYPKLEQPGPEYLLVGAAVALNRVVSLDGKLDIRVMGFVHLAAFLAAFGYLLKATQALRFAPLIWFLALVMATDAGYFTYWNSFYAEPASAIFFVLLMAESVAMCVRKDGVTAGAVLRWSLWAALLVDAKAQNLALAPLLAPFALIAFRKTRASMAGCALVAAAAWFNFATLPASLKMANTYNVVFLSILPESKNPAADLQSLGVDSGLAKFSGTGAWSPGSAFYDLMQTGVIGQRLTPASVARFYFTHPARVWRHAGTLMPAAFSLRPEFCGNFERSAGHPPGATTRSFRIWSTIHARIFGALGRSIPIALLIAPLASILAWFRYPKRRAQIEFGGLLCACALVAFLTAALGDAWDNVKHMYLFNLAFDAVVLSLPGLLDWNRPDCKPMRRI